MSVDLMGSFEDAVYVIRAAVGVYNVGPGPAMASCYVTDGNVQTGTASVTVPAPGAGDAYAAAQITLLGWAVAPAAVSTQVWVQCTPARVLSATVVATRAGLFIMQ